MTVLQIICAYAILFMFVPLMISIVGILAFINKDEYRKAIYMTIVSVALTIIVFALILAVF